MTQNTTEKTFMNEIFQISRKLIDHCSPFLFMNHKLIGYIKLHKVD